MGNEVSSHKKKGQKGKVQNGGLNGHAVNVSDSDLTQTEPNEVTTTQSSTTAPPSTETCQTDGGVPQHSNDIVVQDKFITDCDTYADFEVIQMPEQATKEQQTVTGPQDDSENLVVETENPTSPVDITKENEDNVEQEIVHNEVDVLKKQEAETVTPVEAEWTISSADKNIEDLENTIPTIPAEESGVNGEATPSDQDNTEDATKWESDDGSPDFDVIPMAEEESEQLSHSSEDVKHIVAVEEETTETPSEPQPHSEDRPKDEAEPATETVIDEAEPATKSVTKTCSASAEESVVTHDGPTETQSEPEPTSEDELNTVADAATEIVMVVEETVSVVEETCSAVAEDSAVTQDSKTQEESEPQPTSEETETKEEAEAVTEIVTAVEKIVSAVEKICSAEGSVITQDSPTEEQSDPQPTMEEAETKEESQLATEIVTAVEDIVSAVEEICSVVAESSAATQDSPTEEQSASQPTSETEIKEAELATETLIAVEICSAVAEESAEQSNLEPTGDKTETKEEAEVVTEIVTAVEEIVNAVEEICSVVEEDTAVTQDSTTEEQSDPQPTTEGSETKEESELATDIVTAVEEIVSAVEEICSVVAEASAVTQDSPTEEQSVSQPTIEETETKEDELATETVTAVEEIVTAVEEICSVVADESVTTQDSSTEEQSDPRPTKEGTETKEEAELATEIVTAVEEIVTAVEEICSVVAEASAVTQDSPTEEQSVSQPTIEETETREEAQPASEIVTAVEEIVTAVEEICSVFAEESAEQSNPEPSSDETETKEEAEIVTEIAKAVEEIVTAVEEICSVVADETAATQDGSMEDISETEHHPELPSDDTDTPPTPQPESTAESVNPPQELNSTLKEGDEGTGENAEFQPEVETPTDVTELQTAEVEVPEPQAVLDVPPQVEALPSVSEESCVIDESLIEPCLEPVAVISDGEVSCEDPVQEASVITVHKKAQLTRGLSTDEYTQLLFNLQGACANILGDLSDFGIQSMNVNIASGDNVKLLIEFTLCPNEEAKGE
ncbi:breast carcinoma-amplified sequence 1 isoform X1 [Engraulis encrasicolus]|uniref:breast carcinoma-amplified sequence 1 isoform X1 n=1 Tax=Engraulis encrasicolus TaxID=184585 RepID=UPI002FD0C976